MATILVDYENVFASDGLKGVDALRKDDTLIVFYSDSCRKIRQDFIKTIDASGCKFRILKLKNPGKNALDFYIASAVCWYPGERSSLLLSVMTKDFKLFWIILTIILCRIFMW